MTTTRQIVASEPCREVYVTVRCPHCGTADTPMPYKASADADLRCINCKELFIVTAEAITDAQHVLLVALGEAEPI